MEQLGEEQELMYELRAVIVHRGVVLTSGSNRKSNRNRINDEVVPMIEVDHGHYFAYVRSPSGSDLMNRYEN